MVIGHFFTQELSCLRNSWQNEHAETFITSPGKKPQNVLAAVFMY